MWRAEALPIGCIPSHREFLCTNQTGRLGAATSSVEFEVRMSRTNNGASSWCDNDVRPTLKYPFLFLSGVELAGATFIWFFIRPDRVSWSSWRVASVVCAVLAMG